MFGHALILSLPPFHDLRRVTRDLDIGDVNAGRRYSGDSWTVWGVGGAVALTTGVYGSQSCGVVQVRRFDPLQPLTTGNARAASRAARRIPAKVEQNACEAF